jgi:hypothetical protein
MFKDHGRPTHVFVVFLFISDHIAILYNIIPLRAALKHHEASSIARSTKSHLRDVIEASCLTVQPGPMVHSSPCTM